MIKDIINLEQEHGKKGVLKIEKMIRNNTGIFNDVFLWPNLHNKFQFLFKVKKGLKGGETLMENCKLKNIVNPASILLLNKSNKVKYNKLIYGDFHNLKLGKIEGKNKEEKLEIDYEFSDYFNKNHTYESVNIADKKIKKQL